MLPKSIQKNFNVFYSLFIMRCHPITIIESHLCIRNSIRLGREVIKCIRLRTVGKICVAEWIRRKSTLQNKGVIVNNYINIR